MAYLPTETISIERGSAETDKISLRWAVKLTPYGEQRAARMTEADAEDRALATAHALVLVLAPLFAVAFYFINQAAEQKNEKAWRHRYACCRK